MTLAGLLGLKPALETLRDLVDAKPFPKQAPRYSGAHHLHGPPPLQPYIEEVQKDAARGRPAVGGRSRAGLRAASEALPPSSFASRRSERASAAAASR